MNTLSELITPLIKRFKGDDLHIAVRTTLAAYMLATTKANKAQVLKLVKAQLGEAKKLAQKVMRKKKQVSTQGLPPPLGDLTDMFTAAVREITADLEGGVITPDDWEQEFQILLARYQSASFMTGIGSYDLTDEMITKVSELVGQQFGFLSDFTVEIAKSKGEWQAGWNARADSYAGGLKEPYWTGEVKMLPLPDMPGSGNTICLGNCACSWDVQVVDEEAGSYNAYWRLGDAEHCQSCVVRAREWNPLQIRNGSIV